jgi:teichuronic acid exporter
MPMLSLEKLSAQVKEKLSSRFVRNVGWMGGSDLFVRISYLLTTITLARFLNPYEYGLAAIVVTVFELMQVFTRVGIGVKLIQSDQSDPEAFERLCNAAYWLNWVIFSALFFAQCIVAFGVARFYHEPRLVLPICVLALNYWLIPIASIQASLVLKENRLKVPALTNTIQYSFGNVMAVILAIAGCGIWAIVLPRVLGTPIWVYMFYKNHAWRPSQGFTTEYWGEILSFGKNVLGNQFLKTLRNYIDYLLIGRFVGIGELGAYYFAFNAGLGISMSIINAVNGALFPHLCAARAETAQFQKQYQSCLKTIALIIIPVVLLQSLIAPIYVPLIFGRKWTTAVPILIIICLSAIPRPFADAASNLVTAIGKPFIDLRWNIIFSLVFISTLTAAVRVDWRFLERWHVITGAMIGHHWQSLGMAITVFLCHWCLMPLYTLWASRYVFPNKPAVILP